MSWGYLAPDDAFALVMLGVIALSFATVLVLLVSMLRSSSRRDPEVDRLLDELRRDSPAPARPGDPPRATWERPEDWWR